MKKLSISILFALFGIVPLSAPAQINVNVNIGSQPLWGPVGYQHVDYYYLPDIESYYYVPTREFIYLNNGQWTYTSGLPGRYSDYDLYNGYKVVINSPEPFHRFKEHRANYGRYRSNHSQTIIMRSSNPRYYVVKGHPKHSVKAYKIKHNWKSPKHRDKGNGYSKAHRKGKH